jgi:eukaryotic-like serine/threonine-protein kinase
MGTQRRYLDKYELEELLGRGGMAEVWKAYQPQLQRYVAIKLLHTDLQNDPDFLHRFLREARLIATLHHPNIVQVYDFQTTTLPDNPTPIAYMVMKYIEGQTLARYIRTTAGRNQYPSGEHLLQLFAAIGRAIDYAHAHNMIHRDIKPANILLDKHNTTHFPEGEPILTDFGIARLLGTVSGTISHNWAGTPLYISPEQAQGQSGTAYSDIYSLGVILYEMCTGVLPFRGENIPAIIFQQVNTNPVSPSVLNPQIPPALASVIMHCLVKDPTRRFQTASALVIALAEALNLPVPADMSQSAPAFGYSSGQNWSGTKGPTIVTPSPLPPVSMPFNAVPPIIAQNTPARNMQTPIFESNPSLEDAPTRLRPRKQPNPITPLLTFDSMDLLGQPAAASSTPVLPVQPASPPATNSRQLIPKLPQSKPQFLRAGLLVVLILLLLAAGLGGIYWLTHRNGAPVSNAQVVGSVSFVNSGQISEENNNGENDGIIIRLQNLQPPANGNAYYAWLLSDMKNTEGNTISLGKLSVTNGKAYLEYFEPNHTNLLAITSRFLITEESTNNPPNMYTPDQKAWRYYAEISQTPNPQDASHFSLLDHLRHLLASDPKLNKVNLPGGLDIWFFRNTEKVLEWSGSARDYWQNGNADGVRNQIIRVLDYLDGDKFVDLDVPPGTPNLVNPTIAPVALLEFDETKQMPPGYLYHIDVHLHGLISSPGVTDAQRRLAGQIDAYINNVQTWLQHVRQDARQEMLSQSDLLSKDSLSLLDDMETYARYAFVGKADPSTNQVLGGAVQIYNDSQLMAQLTVTALSS